MDMTPDSLRHMAEALETWAIGHQTVVLQEKSRKAEASAISEAASIFFERFEDRAAGEEKIEISGDEFRQLRRFYSFLGGKRARRFDYEQESAYQAAFEIAGNLRKMAAFLELENLVEK